MARSRKTVDVDEFRIKVNDMIALSTCSPEGRKGMMLVLEEVLHSTNNYRGFGYLRQKDVPEGELPGIVDVENGFEFPDPTRVQYY